MKPIAESPSPESQQHAQRLNTLKTRKKYAGCHQIKAEVQLPAVLTAGERKKHKTPGDFMAPNFITLLPVLFEGIDCEWTKS